MPSAAPPNPRVVSHELDDHEYDDAIEDLFKDLPIERGSSNNNNSAPADPTKDIDQEVIVKKQRKPVPKLDETRLLSQDGIPRLRKITKSRLRFKGKGHEFSDVSRLLNMYQLWLDDLYPRAKFKDALVMVEKVGHSNRMKVMRKAWLDDTKPFRKDADIEEPVDLVMSGALPANTGEEGTNAVDGDDNDASFVEAERRRQATKDSDHGQSDSNNGPDDDELDTLLAENETSRSATHTQQGTRRENRGPFEQDSDDDNDDDLDALLAVESARDSTRVPPGVAESRNETMPNAKAIDDEFAAEEEIMADMDLW